MANGGRVTLVLSPDAMQIWLYARTRKSHPGYEESTHEESLLCGQYRNSAFEMHNKEVSWHRMVSMRT
jgi:hypothetical protein